MIPKTIHYCWFGHGEMTPLMKKCVNSWKKYCKDWKIIEWNEDNIDISSMPLYVRQAYEAKKWGFVPDYIRLWLVYNYGGIYLDTDVEIIKPLDNLLELQAFAGFEDGKHVAFGLGFGAEKGNHILKRLMDSYVALHFYNEDGSLNLTASPQLNTKVLLDVGLQCNNTMQELEEMTIFPMEYFCPVKAGKITKNTYTIHHFAGSWCPPEEQEANRNYVKYQLSKHKWLWRAKSALASRAQRVLGEEAYLKLRKIVK